MANNNSFIAAYKALEAAIQEKTSFRTVLEYEQTLPEKEAKKLQLCRVTRNFVQHDDPKFVTASDAMVKFLLDEREILLTKGKLAKDVCKKVKPVLGADKVEDAAVLLEKCTAVPVVDAEKCFVGLLTDSSIRKAVNQKSLKKKILAASVFSSEFNVVCAKEYASEVPEGLCVVTTDGSEHGKYVGLILPKEKG